jgi:hypothetical protein
MSGYSSGLEATNASSEAGYTKAIILKFVRCAFHWQNGRSPYMGSYEAFPTGQMFRLFAG